MTQKTAVERKDPNINKSKQAANEIIIEGALAWIVKDQFITNAYIQNFDVLIALKMSRL